jgi:hypothetical protein
VQLHSTARHSKSTFCYVNKTRDFDLGGVPGGSTRNLDLLLPAARYGARITSKLSDSLRVTGGFKPTGNNKCRRSRDGSRLHIDGTGSGVGEGLAGASVDPFTFLDLTHSYLLRFRHSSGAFYRWLVRPYGSSRNLGTASRLQRCECFSASANEVMVPQRQRQRLTVRGDAPVLF